MDTRQEKAQVRVSCSSGKKLRWEDDSVCKRSDVGCDLDPLRSHAKVIEGSRGKWDSPIFEGNDAIFPLLMKLSI